MEIGLEFLTPGFLYGANRAKSEFRIASLIGQMRYWWRMTQDWSDIDRLRKNEASIFGLSDEMPPKEANLCDHTSHHSTLLM